MDEQNRIPLIGIILVSAFIVGSVSLALFVLVPNTLSQVIDSGKQIFLGNETQLSQESIATFTAQPQTEGNVSIPILNPDIADAQIFLVSLEDLYDQVGPGVVSVQVFTERNGMVGQGAGSGFILDNEGHIITNNHVVEDASLVSVIFFNGIEVRAEIVGTDVDSDLAVLKVDGLIDEVHPLPLGNSDNIDVGEWVIAIGNPFGNQNSLSIGIVSALGRTIPTGATPFSIPQSIQTDAAINPGNSGGPLINLEGDVIGVNAQIATSGERANSGVGFAIPVNILRKVAPALIELGAYVWPWMGIEGTDVTLAITQANELERQRGAYINRIVVDAPADSAGLVGTNGTTEIEGILTPIGGDVVVEADGEPINFFSDLLVAVAFKNPGETIDLVIIRDGERVEITVELQARP
ncbi:MAG: trypsin-like peptidase domain-containing protein [Anaerolineales bacterium]|nr:trypsin-like peptidase domain-containing protein [Anaerolineales bacterium]